MLDPTTFNYEESLKSFQDTARAVAAVAKTFRGALGEEDKEDGAYMIAPEEGPMVTRLPLPAYCLRTAMQLWQQTAGMLLHAHVQQCQQPGCGDGYMPAVPVLPPGAAMHVFANQALATAPVEDVVLKILSRFNQEVRQKVIDALQEGMQPKEAPPAKNNGV